MAAISVEHLTNIQEEIYAFIAERTDYDEAHLHSREMADYIQHQVETVAAGMCSVGEDDGFHPINVDPSVEKDYYREAIEEYGTLYTDYQEESDLVGREL